MAFLARAGSQTSSLHNFLKYTVIKSGTFTTSDVGSSLLPRLRTLTKLQTAGQSRLYSCMNSVVSVGLAGSRKKLGQSCFVIGKQGHSGRPCRRWMSQHQQSGRGGANSEGTKTTVIYISAMGVFMLGAAYAGVPLYQMFCQATGLGGKATKGHDVSKVETMEPIIDRVITVQFMSDVHAEMQWKFQPQQHEIKVIPGETALAFYTATNPTDRPIIGISTYNISPLPAAQYFNKIQCFCFEEQLLNPHEQVDMPVFFYIDPEYADDPLLENLDSIVLSYTFFEAEEGLQLPYPGFQTPQTPQPQPQQPQPQTPQPQQTQLPPAPQPQVQ